jgi:hypothetical protein
MASYILRGIDPDQWHKFKLKALEEKVSLKTLIVRLLTDWLNG